MRVLAIAMLLAFAAVLIALVAIASAQETTEDDAIREHLANLSTTEKEELRRKRDQFQQLDESEQERLRQLHTTLASSPDRDRLEATLLQYHEWLKSLPGKERAELLKLPPEEKIAEIKRLMQEQRSQQFRKLVATPPESQDVRGIFAWFDSYVEAHEAELMATLPEGTQSRLKQVSLDGIRRKMLVMALHQNESEPKFPAPTADDLQKLNERLSPQAQETLAKVMDPEEKLKVVQGWIRAAMMSRMLPPQISEERLMSFYRENRERLRQQDPAKVDELDSMPPEAFYQEVRGIYARQSGHGSWRGHRRDGDWRDGPRGDWNRDDRSRGGDGPHRPRGNEGRPPEGFRPPPPPDGNHSPAVGDAIDFPPPPTE